MKKLKIEDITYIEHLSKEMVKELKAFYRDTKDDEFYPVSGNEHRARFNRLRVELHKAMVKAKWDIYYV